MGTQLLKDLMLKASEVCSHSDWQVIIGPLSLVESSLLGLALRAEATTPYPLIRFPPLIMYRNTWN